MNIFLYSLFIKDSLGNFNKYFNQFIVVSYILKLLFDLYKHILYATKQLYYKYKFQELMQPPLNDSEIFLKVTEEIGQYPCDIAQIQYGIKQARKSDKRLIVMDENQIRKKVVDSNLKLIEAQFVNMMNNVLKKIQPELEKYPQHKSIKYLDAIIYEHLDPIIYGKDVRISKIRNTLLDNQVQDGLNIADKLFTELITVMNQLLQIMRQHYGYPRDQKISGILFKCIHDFVTQNQTCFLVMQDKKSQKEEAKKQVSNMSQSQSNVRKALNTAESLIGTIYANVRQLNPFSANKLTEKQIQQNQQLMKIAQSTKKRDPLDEHTVKILRQLGEMDPVAIIKTMTKDEKEEFFALLIEALEETSKLKTKSRLSRIQHIEEEISQFLASTIDVQHPSTTDKFKEYKQLKWIVLLYKALEKKYYTDSQRRKWLMRFCQNKRICSKLHNPFSVIKTLQSEKLEESEILKMLRTLPICMPVEGKKMDQQLDEKELSVHYAVEHEMNRIHIYQLKKKYAKEPNLKIQRLSDHKRRVVTFFISGFLSEDTCKFNEWSGILNNFYDSEVYSIRWESKTIKNMMDYAIKSAVQLGPTQSIAMLGGPYIKAIAIMHNLYQKFQDNPFNPAFDAAGATGEFMAEFLMYNFKGYFINLVGFSLGTELVRNLMDRLLQKGQIHMINKVYFIGGVADQGQIEKLLQASPSPLTIINLYSDNDYVLKYLLRLCKSGINPIGLGPIKQIQGHTIKNRDCTYFVEGHLSYRSNLQFFAKILKMADD